MHHDDTHEVMQAAIRRTESGAIDTDYYHQRAQIMRAGFLRAVISCLVRGGRRAWDCIKAKMRERTTRRALSVLSSRELKDLGLTRSDFDALGDGSYFSDPTRYARSRERLSKCA
jgi:uncharacterized protein YjiS (DUF1127 family)